MYVPADTRRPRPDIPVATTIPARTPPGTRVPPGLFPGVPVTRGHPHGHLGTPHPALAPGPHGEHYGDAMGAALGEPAATDAPVAGLADVRGHLRGGC